MDSANKYIISDLIQKDKERYTDLVAKFLKLLPDYTAEFSVHVEAKDYVKLKSVVHRLKGAGGNFGYMQLTHICKEMEEAIAEDDFDGVNRLHAQLIDTCDNILLGWEQCN